MKWSLTLFPVGLFIVVVTACQSVADRMLVKIKEGSTTIWITDVTIFNGKDSVLIPHQQVLIEDGFIRQITDTLPDQNDRNTMVIDGGGKILMPGLIDAHVHLSGSGAVPWKNISANPDYNLSAYLYTGITTVYDLGGMAKDISQLAEKVEQGELLGPTVYHTHLPITVKNSHPVPLAQIMLPWPLKSLANTITPTIDQAAEAPDIIQKYSERGVDYVKIACDQIPPGSPKMSFEQLRALIDEAHKLDKKVFVHVGSPENAVHAARAGADVLAHGIWRGRLNPSQADTIASYHIPVIYTLAGFHNVSQINQGTFTPSALDQELVDERILTPVSEEKGKDVHTQAVMNRFFEDVERHEQHWQHNFTLLHERKVPMAVGTDSNLPGTYAGSTYFQELKLLQDYGLSTFEVLRAATYLNATLFLDNPDFGTIEEGKRANLLLLEGNPLENLKLLQAPSIIIMNGKIIEKSSNDSI